MAENPSITFLWKIENWYYYCPQKDIEYLESPKFYVNSLSKSAWSLRIHTSFNGDQEEVKVYLYNYYYNEGSTLLIDYEISFLSADGSTIFAGKERNRRIDAENSYQILTYRTYDEVFESIRKKFQLQDILTIQCRIWKTRKRLTHPIQYFARTRIGIQSRSFHWAVKEFSQLKLSKKRTRKIIGGEQEPTFSIELSLKGAYAKQVAINISQDTANISKFFSTWKISALDATGNVVNSKEDYICFSSPSVYSFPCFLTKNELTARKTKCLVDDVLNLVFNFTFSTNVDYSNIESVSSLPPWIRNTSVGTKVACESDQSVISKSNDASSAILHGDLLSLYEDKTFSDFELRVESESFRVHKCVLVSRSPVFKAMLSSDMKEGSADFLDIPDVDADSIERLLIFVYTGNVDNLKCESASKLYYAADKYEILSLKQKCSAFLASNISYSNVCEILLLADRHYDEELKSAVHDFIVLNDSKIIRSTEWKQFLVCNPIIAAETMQLVYSKKLDMEET